MPAMVLALTFGFSAQADAHARARQLHVHRLHGHAHAHGIGPKAHRAACAGTHSRHGAHACSSVKEHRHKTGSQVHRRHTTSDSRHISPPSTVQTPAPVALGGPTGTTCPDGHNATLDEEGGFACGDGAEPGCQEGFAPVIASDGSTLVCEPEAKEDDGEAEG